MSLVAQNKSSGSENGQILVVVILVVVVALTVGLSLASRTITNLRSSSEEAQSQKALAAAEAGVERAIQSNTPVTIYSPHDIGNNSSYVTTSTPAQNSTFKLNGGNLIQKDEGADIWFVPHDPSTDNPVYTSPATFQGRLNLYWGSPSDDCYSSTNKPAAIQVIIVTGNGAAAKSYRYAYDSCSRANNFTTANGISTYPLNGVTYGNRTPNNDLASGLSNIVMVRVVPIYKDTVVGVQACSQSGSSCTSLPLQGYNIDSTGKSGDANRRITVFKGWPQTYLPYLSYGLFVAGN